ncbi:MAG: cytochrome c [Proteobacteria bacterium]|nr:cytochrome c [Pseudomonadota bacterium]
MFLESGAFLIAFAGGGAVEAADAVAQGRALAGQHCAKCHAIGRTDESLHDEAPPFRRLHERYPIATLGEAFAEGIVVGHKDMPAFEFSPAEIEALLGYIESLGPKRRR